MKKTNIQEARTLDGLYLRPMNTHQGTHQLLHLPANRIVTCRKLTRLPMTQSIIDQVHVITKKR